MTKLRINFVFPRPNLSGGIKSNRLIAEAMVRRGHDVTLVYPAGSPPWPMPWRLKSFMHRWRWKGGEAHHLERSTARVLATAGAEVVAEDVPDADVSIATFWRTMEWMADWPGSKGKRAYFVRGYETWGGEPERVKATYRLPSLKVVISSWLKRLMADEFGDPHAVLVPNGVDRRQFSFVPRGKAERPTVGLVYGAIALKGAKTAFEAIRIAQRDVPTLRCVCFGAHPVVAEHRPPDNFEMHVAPEQGRIADLYRSADCWLMPSVQEGFGMPGLEAAACGCPVVATRCGGAEDYVVEGESGHLVDVGDAEAMAKRIVDVVTRSDGEWRGMSERSFEVSRGFDWDGSAERLEKALVEYVLNTKHQTPNTKLQMAEGVA